MAEVVYRCSRCNRPTSLHVTNYDGWCKACQRGAKRFRDRRERDGLSPILTIEDVQCLTRKALADEIDRRLELMRQGEPFR